MRLTLPLVAVALSACASMGAPPGGPERDTPPVLLSVTPDSGAVNFRGENAVFQFDVVVNDRSGGASGVEGLFLISPAQGTPRVRWRRSRIEVRPRRGFRPNTAYSITMLPGIADLRGNVLQSARTIVFSTGAVIPPFMAMGRVFDWSNGRPAANAYVEVLRLPDSLRYLGTADSTGQFAIGPLEEGSYIIRGIMDNNRNRSADRDEPWDSLAVTIRGTSPFVELLAAQRDTVPPRVLTVSAPDSLSLLVSFDKVLSPEVPLTPASFRVLASDSTRLTVTRVRTRAQADAERAARDSIVRADSVRGDTARRPPPPPPGQGQRPPQPVAQRPAVPIPTAQPVRASRPAPARDIVLTIDSTTPLRLNASYRVVAVNVTGLLGVPRTSDRVFTISGWGTGAPGGGARRDTTAAPPNPQQPNRPPTGVRRP